MIHYKNPQEPKTIVKLRLRGSEVEFDIFLARLSLEGHPYGQDVTVNWRSLDIVPERPGLFYTDANAYKIVKRDINASRNISIQGPLNKIKQVA